MSLIANAESGTSKYVTILVPTGVSSERINCDHPLGWIFWFSQALLLVLRDPLGKALGLGPMAWTFTPLGPWGWNPGPRPLGPLGPGGALRPDLRPRVFRTFGPQGLVRPITLIICGLQ